MEETNSVRDTFMLVVRALAGFVVGAVVGLVADFALQTQGYWVVAAMAGAIAALASLYVDTPFRRQGAGDKPKVTTSKKRHARGKK